MSRLRCARVLSLVIVSAMPLGVLAPACSSTNTSTAGQRISCMVTSAGATNCHPDASGSAGSGSDTCDDIDEDGDGSPHDVGEDHHDATGAPTGTQTGSSAASDDDDGDGISNERDCDKRHGGDDDGEEHDGSGGDDGSGDGSGSGDHDGSGSGSGSTDGSGHV